MCQQRGRKDCGSFDRTYEELKPGTAEGNAGEPERFDRTYEELKPK